MTASTILTHKETGFTLNVTDMSVPAITAKLAEAGHSIGATSLRNLLKGNVATAVGFEMSLEDDSKPAAKAAEAPKADTTEVADGPTDNDGDDGELTTKPADEEPAKADDEESEPDAPKAKEEEPKREDSFDEVVNIPTFLDAGKRGAVFGWVNFECKEAALAAKTTRMARKLGRIAKSPKLADEAMTVGLVNRGGNDMINLYNPDMTIAYVVVPKKRYEDGAEASVEDASGKKLVNGSWKDVVAFFMS